MQIEIWWSGLRIAGEILPHVMMVWGDVIIEEYDDLMWATWFLSYVECFKLYISVYGHQNFLEKSAWHKFIQGSEGGCTAIFTVIVAHPSLTQFANFTLVNNGELWHWCQSRPLCPTIGNTICFLFPSLRLLSCPICKLSSIRSLCLHNICQGWSSL
jgi:hypothetical protein